MHSIWYQMLKIASVSEAPPQTPIGELTTLPHTQSLGASCLPRSLPSVPLMPVGPIVQGSGLGPTDFVTAISSLKPKYSENRLTKYADDRSTCWSLLFALTALFLNLTISLSGHQLGILN